MEDSQASLEALSLISCVTLVHVKQKTERCFWLDPRNWLGKQLARYCL